MAYGLIGLNDVLWSTSVWSMAYGLLAYGLWSTSAWSMVYGLLAYGLWPTSAWSMVYDLLAMRRRSVWAAISTSLARSVGPAAMFIT